MKQLYFSTDQIKKFGVAQWLATIVLLFLVAVLASSFVRTYFTAGVLDHYLFVFFAELTLFVGITLWVRGRLHYHLHHYALAMVAISLIGY